MPVYQYQGYRSDGGAATGIIDAENVRVARLKLRKEGVYPTDVVEQNQPSVRPQEPGRSATARTTGKSSVLSASDLSLLTRQFATLLVAGLPLVDALGVLVDQAQKKPLKALLADIREQIRGGKALSVVLESYEKDFSPIYVHMVRAGEASGALDQILFRLAEFLEKQQALRNKVTNAMLYPIIMLVIGTIILFFLITFVVPKITQVFAQQKQALPWPTVALMSVSEFMADYWMVLVGVVVGGLYLIRRFAHTARGRMVADRVTLRLPLIGDVARMVSISRLTSTLSTMLASGVQLLDALDVSKRVMNNRVLEETVEGARQNIREGETIADPLKRSGEFPALVTHMIAVGEKSGEMEEMLRRVSQIYDSEVERVIARLTSLMEPIMILVMGAIVLFIVVAILLPIFEMGQMIR
ncbi:MAG: type II secretion system inner membrane protein GspF [Nitrospira sp.]|nr:type II secretion system inner membrane protein GspF [Nitrospira sp.]MDH4370547.1 type II secretion system inner membrane protein GspF [Nitrospira sp.]MDH5498756.1 type II secretion system inner membrane protein GspF [Nitrospira sp.]MDH5726733.1 type II secretion system inner membrane protein GspF [Nitrospira sp.]